MSSKNEENPGVTENSLNQFTAGLRGGDDFNFLFPGRENESPVINYSSRWCKTPTQQDSLRDGRESSGAIREGNGVFLDFAEYRGAGPAPL